MRDLAESSSPGSVGASGITTGTAGLAAARLQADEVLAAAGELDLRAATHEQVWDTIVLRRAATAVEFVVQVELQRLRDADRAEGTELSATLLAWLENWGDVNAAAATLNVHPNTVRMRMKKTERIVGASLDTPAQRLAAFLLLRSRNS